MKDMKSILLIGLGRFGKHMAMKLHELGHQVMAVDRIEDRVEAVMPYVHSAQIGDSMDIDFLQSLGIRNFDVCFVTISADFQSSLETTANLKELGAKLIVSRAARDTQARFLKMAGADEILYPEKQIGNWAAIRFSSSHIFDYVELAEGYAIFELDIPESWVGKSILELDIRKKYNINIIAIKKKGTMSVNITPDIVLDQEDMIMVVGKESQIHKYFHI